MLEAQQRAEHEAQEENSNGGAKRKTGVKVRVPARLTRRDILEERGW